MRTATFISDTGGIATFVNRPPYLFNKIISDLSSESQTEKTPQQDGQKIYNTNLNGLTITLKGYVHAAGNRLISTKTVLDEHKNFLNNVFNPKRFGTLIYNNERGGQLIRARPIVNPTYGDTSNFQNVSIDVEFETEDSTWGSYELYSEPLGAVTALWKFPFTLTEHFKFGEYVSEVVINNPSSAIIEPYAEVYTNSEFITITNGTTRDYITINHAIAEGQTMIIDTKTATVVLYENGVEVGNVSNWVTRDSSYLTLVPGENKLKISNEIQNSPMNAKLFYRIPVMGV